MFKHTQFVPLYRIKEDKPNKEVECSKSLDFCFRTKRKKQLNNQTKKKKTDSWSCSSQQKGKGIGQCIQRQAHHALDGNRSWFGHLA